MRLLLFAWSPAINAFDDHKEAVALWAGLSRPAVDACWQCYQPPAYYVVSAAVLRAAAAVSGDNETAWRAVQLLSVLFSLGMLALGWRILELAGPRAAGPRLCAFAVLVFLPRDVYGAVFLSNDAMLAFAVTLAVWIHLEAAARGGGLGWLAALLLATTLAAWTKQHGLITLLLPPALLLALRRGDRPPDTRRGIALLALGLLVAAGDEIYRTAVTGHLLVSNQHYFDWPSVQRPGSVAATSFFDLRLSSLFRYPWHSDATVDSFWTQVFGRLWFDFDPKFLIDTPATRTLAAARYALGLPLSLAFLLGLGLALRRWRGAPERLALVALQLAFLAVPVVQTLRLPYWSSMKATFFLPAAPIAAVLLSLAFERMWRARPLRLAILACCAALAVLAAWECALVREQIFEALRRSYLEGKLWPYPPGWGTR